MQMTARCFRVIVLLLVALAFLLSGIPGYLTARAATCTVTTGADSGPGSLREKIGDASCDAIVFAGDYTITLASQLTIDRSVTIDGTGHNVTVSGNNSVRVFSVGPGVTFNAKRMTVANGRTTGDGGGIYADESTVVVTDSHFSGNTGDWGGGISIYFGTLTVTNSTFSGNTAERGGGIYTYSSSGTVNVANSTFSGNRATYGGGIRANYSSVTVSDSTFSANDASDSGGGIVTTGGALAVTNSTFSGNSAYGASGGGGGIDNGGTLIVTNSTFSGNRAEDGFGGGIYNNGSATAKNVILDNNRPGYNCAGAAMSGFNNLSSDYGCGESFAQSTSIWLGTLGNYGGNTQTIPLLPGSSAINAGHGATCADPATVNNLDQRGFARPADQCDIGAFEFCLANTTTSLISSPNPSNPGQSVTFTAQVNESDPGTPIGIVTFKDGATTLGSGALDGAGQATFSTSDLAPGTHAITAEYSGNAVFGGSTSPEVSQVVRFNTTTTLSSSANPSPGPVTFTATVAPTPDDGTVTFKNGGADIAGCAGVSLSAGQATCTIGALAPGTSSVTAVYSGYGWYLASTSAALIQAVYARPAIDAGSAHTCEVKTDGSLVCWGDNSEGQSNVPSTSSPWMQVSAGGSYTCGVKADGTLACWGYNYNGQANVPSPNENWIQVSAGYNHTCGVKADGTIICWGWNAYGQTNVPGPNENWVQVANGYIHTCGLKTDGMIICWGDDSYGQGDVPSPNTNWVQVTAGYAHSCGLKADGSLVCWGDNGVGQNNVPSPNTNWVQAGPGGTQTCGVKSDGTLACWGSNYYGQLNVPSTTSPWAQVTAGGGHTCGLKADGTIACWGWNDRGQAPVVSLVPAMLPNAVAGSGYVQNLGASGGTAPPYTFSVIAGSPPTGLTLNADGTWSGAPTASGTFNLTAQAVDANNIAGSRDYTLVVHAPTTTALASAVNPSVSGEPVILTATVSESDPATPSGTVTFKDGGTTLGTGSLDAAGQATFTTLALAVGAHNLTAEYSGDASFLASTSPVSVHAVDKAGTTTILTADADDPSLVGQAVSVSFAVSAVAPGSGTPTGSVTVSDGGGTSCVGSLSGGSGSCSLAFTTPGLKTLVASYGGDGSYDSSTSAGEEHTVNAADTFADPAGLCGGNLPCYPSMQAAIDNAGVGYKATVYAGVYDEAVDLDRDVSIVLHDGVTLNGALTLAAGTLDAGPGLFTVNGDWTLLDGAAWNANGGTVVLNGAVQAIGGGPATAFHNLSLSGGLLGYWKFDEGSGSSALDSSGNNGPGALTNGAGYAAGGPLAFGSPWALLLDGADDYLSVPDDPALRASVFTLAFWMRWDDQGSDQVQFIAAKGIERYELHTGGGAGVNGLRFIPAGFDATGVDAPGALHAGWNHVAVVYTGATASVYVDGAPVASRAGIAGGHDLSADASPLLLGRRGDGSYPFHGALDDVRFYGRALPAAEIGALAAGNQPTTVTLAAPLVVAGNLTLNAATLDVSAGNQPFSVGGDWINNGGTFYGYGGTVTLNGIRSQVFSPEGAELYNLVVDEGLLGYWRLDEGSGTAALDDSGLGRNGELRGGPVYAAGTTLDFTNPHALAFDGADDSVLVADEPALRPGAFTLAFWLRWDGLGTDAVEFLTAKGLGNYELHTGGDAGTNGLRFIPAGFPATHVDATSALHAGWNHVAAVYSGSETTLYVDGSPVASRTGISGGNDLSADIGPLRLGLRGDDSFPFHGALDDVRFYGRALAPAEVGTLAGGDQARNQVDLATALTLRGNYHQLSGAFVGGNADVTIAGDVTLAGGTLAAPAAWLQVGGDLVRTGGTFDHNSGTVRMAGIEPQGLSGSFTFYNLAIGPSAVVDIDADPLFRVAGSVANNGTLRQTRLTPGGAVTEFLHILDPSGTADRYRGLVLEPASDMGLTTVTVFGNQWCPEASAGVRRCYEIEPDVAQVAAVSFYFTEAERNEQTLNYLSAWHWAGSSWEQQVGTTTTGGSGDGQWLRVEGVSAYSPFMLAHASPTAIPLARFQARQQGTGWWLAWETTSDAEVSGFFLYRSQEMAGPRTRLNQALLPVQMPGSPLGATYTFLDETAGQGTTYYWLEIVNVNGGVMQVGPALASTSHSVFLPVVQRR